jgi:hypothetical protein
VASEEKAASDPVSEKATRGARYHRLPSAFACSPDELTVILSVWGGVCAGAVPCVIETAAADSSAPASCLRMLARIRGRLPSPRAARGGRPLCLRSGVSAARRLTVGRDMEPN